MNTNHWGLLAIALTIIAVGGLVMLVVIPTPDPTTNVGINQPATSTATTTGGGNTGTTTSSQWPKKYKDVLEVNAPVITKTQIVVTGKARTWYFEASFPVELRDASGKVILQHYAQAQGEWMTSEFVPFVSTLTFPAQPAGSSGTLVFHKDNPSGLPQHDDKYEVPITFQ